MNSKAARILCTIGTVLSGAFLIIISILRVLGAFCVLYLGTFLQKMTQNEQLTDSTFVTHLLFGAVYLLPAALFGGLLYTAVKPHPRAWLWASLGSGGITALTAVLYYFRHPLPELLLIAILATAIGSFGCIACFLLYEWLQKKLPSVFNRETVSYIVFGALTTVVSFVSQMLFSSLGWHVTVNTIGSWVCAVLFAYVVNKLFVFESKTNTASAFWRELGLFIGARVASLGMELAFMFVTVELLRFSEPVCKLIAQVFILIANYIFSKLVIFKKK